MEESNKDRISEYLSPRIKDMMFAELSRDWLDRTGAAEILGGVAVPVNTDAGEIDVRDIVLDMTLAMSRTMSLTRMPERSMSGT